MSSDQPINDILPVEIITRIIRTAANDDLKWLMKLRKLSKWFYNATNNRSFWKAIGIKLNLSSNQFGYVVINGQVFYDCNAQRPLIPLLKLIPFRSLTYELNEDHSYALSKLLHLFPESWQLKQLHIRSQTYEIAHIRAFLDTLLKLNLHSQLQDLSFVRCQELDGKLKINLKNETKMTESEVQVLTAFYDIASTARRLRSVRISFSNSDLHSSLQNAIHKQTKVTTLCLENLRQIELATVVALCNSLPNLSTLQVLRNDITLANAQLLGTQLSAQCRRGIKHLALSFGLLPTMELEYDLHNAFVNLQNCLLEFSRGAGGYEKSQIKGILRNILESHSLPKDGYPHLKILIESKAMEQINAYQHKTNIKSDLASLTLDFGHVLGCCELQGAEFTKTPPVRSRRGFLLMTFGLHYSKSVPYTMKCALLEEKAPFTIQPKPKPANQRYLNF